MNRMLAHLLNRRAGATGRRNTELYVVVTEYGEWSPTIFGSRSSSTGYSTSYPRIGGTGTGLYRSITQYIG